MCIKNGSNGFPKIVFYRFNPCRRPCTVLEARKMNLEVHFSGMSYAVGRISRFLWFQSMYLVVGLDLLDSAGTVILGMWTTTCFLLRGRTHTVR